ncbi:hypothetical protein HZS_7448, partial [Henneguya salminicola]
MQNGVGEIEVSEIREHYEVNLFDEFIERANILDPIDEREFNELDFDEKDVMLSRADEPTNFHTDKNTNEEVCDEEDQKVIEKKVTKKKVYNAFQVIKDYFNQECFFDRNAMIGINQI